LADYKPDAWYVTSSGYDCLSMGSSVTHRFLRVSEAAAVLRLSRSSVYRRIDDGSLPAFRAGREHGPLLIRTRDVDALLRPARPEETR
jgi:excisionase family DNA binding protein